MLSICKYYFFEGELPPLPTPEEFRNGIDYYDRGPEIPEDVRREAEASTKSIMADDEKLRRDSEEQAKQLLDKYNAERYSNQVASIKSNLPPLPMPEELGIGTNHIAQSPVSGYQKGQLPPISSMKDLGLKEDPLYVDKY